MTSGRRTDRHSVPSLVSACASRELIFESPFLSASVEKFDVRPETWERQDATVEARFFPEFAAFSGNAVRYSSGAVRGAIVCGVRRFVWLFAPLPSVGSCPFFCFRMRARFFYSASRSLWYSCHSSAIMVLIWNIGSGRNADFSSEYSPASNAPSRLTSFGRLNALSTLDALTATSPTQINAPEPFFSKRSPTAASLHEALAMSLIL